jgi:hypothetical protein
MEVAREAIRRRHSGCRTEPSWVRWIRRFVRFHGKRHPREMGAGVTAMLDHLAIAGGVASATQNQALSALLVLYGVVLEAL